MMELPELHKNEFYQCYRYHKKRSGRVEVLILEAERCFTLTYGYSSGDFDDVVVKSSAYVVEI